MTTVCPMCQMNLDAYQSEANRHFGTNFHMPIVFFTQLIGLALGIAPEKLGFGMELTSAKKALGRIGTEIKQVAAPKAPRKKGEGLPMPPRLLKNAPKQKVEVEK